MLVYSIYVSMLHIQLVAFGCHSDLVAWRAFELGTVIVALLLEALKSGLTLLDPLFDDLVVQVNEHDSHVVSTRVFSFHGLRLDWGLLSLLEICNLTLNFLFALLQRNFHHVNGFIGLQSRGVLALQHLLGAELTFLDLGNLSQWDDQAGALWRSSVGHIVFIDKESVMVQHEVSFNQAVVFYIELADMAVKKDLISLTSRDLALASQALVWIGLIDFRDLRQDISKFVFGPFPFSLLLDASES